MDDQSGSGEGAKPPSIEPMRRRRSRKLSGVSAQAVGDLAFAIYVALEAPDFKSVLTRELVRWRARYL